MHLARLGILRKVASIIAIIYLSGEKKIEIFSRDDFLFKKVKFSQIAIIFRMRIK